MIMLNFQGQGQRMGGGKGPIDHYVTPVKARRVILEMGGKCEFIEVSHLCNGFVLFCISSNLYLYLHLYTYFISGF
jgi:Ribosomal protein L16/L10E